MEGLGIPVVIVAVGRGDLLGILDEFQMAGTILGSGERVEQLVDYELSATECEQILKGPRRRDRAPDQPGRSA